MNQSLYEQLLNSGIMVLNREKMNKKIEEYQQEIQGYHADLDAIAQKIHQKPHGYSAKKGWGIFFVAFGSLLAIANTIMIFMLLTGNDSINSCGVIFDFLIAVAFYLPLLIGILLLCSARKFRINSKKAAELEYEKTKMDITEPKTKELNLKIESIMEEIDHFWNLHKSLIEFLPEKYQTLDAVAFMLESVKNLRANTLTDVINLYEEELRWRKTKAIITQQTMLQQLQSQRLNDTLREIELNQQKLHSDLQSIQTMQLFDMLKR